MSVNFGGKKIKELYFGGKKIKEAWYGGKKVFSSGGGWRGRWRPGVEYLAGDVVVHSPYVPSETYNFQCIKSHTSNVDNEPFKGILESAYWTIVYD